MRTLARELALYAVLCVLVWTVNLRIRAELGFSSGHFVEVSEGARRDIVDSEVAELEDADQVLDVTMREFLEAPNPNRVGVASRPAVIRASEELLAAGAERVSPARIQRGDDGTQTASLVVVELEDEEGTQTETIVALAMRICAVDAAALEEPSAAVRRGHRFVLLDGGCDWRSP